MKGTIEELWHGNIIPHEDSLTNSPEMKELLSYIARHHEDLEKSFTDEQRIYNQIIPKIGNVPLNQVTAGTLEKFYAHLKSDGRIVRREIYGEGLSNSVIRSMHAHCRASLEKARVEGLIRQNQATHCKLPPKKSVEIEILTVE